MRLKLIAIALLALSVSAHSQTFSTNETILRNAINRLATTKLNKADSNAAYISLYYFNTHAGVDTKWDGNAVGLNAVTARTSLGLGSFALIDSTEFKLRLAGTYALITSIPTTLPASDVYSWAKAVSKPTYTASDVGAITAAAARDTVIAHGVGVNGTAGQDAYFVTTDSLGSRARIDTVYLHAGKFKTVDDSIAALRSDLGNVSGGGSSNVTSWSSAFTGADVADTLTWPGMHTYDIVTVSPVSSSVIDTVSIYPLSAWLDTNRVIVSRKYGNESGQKYNIMRVPGAMAPVTNVVASGIQSAVQVTWTPPVSSSSSTANSLDSIVVCWDSLGYVDPSTAGARKRCLAKTTTVDTIPSLAPSQQYFVSVFSRSRANEYGTASQDTAVVRSVPTVVDTAKSTWFAATATKKVPVTLTTLTNGYLVVAVGYYRYGGNVKCTWRDTQMDSLGIRYANSQGVAMFGMKSPTVGADTIIVSFIDSTAREGVVDIASFNGVNQTTPTGTFAGSNGNNTSPALTVSSATGELAINAMSTFGTPLSTTNTMLVFGYNAPSTTHCIMSRANGSSSVSMGYTITSMYWTMGGISLKP